MASIPRFKIYRDGEYIAAVKYLEDAAAIAGMTIGTEVRDGHTKRDIIFTEGKEKVLAADSWDGAASFMRYVLINMGRFSD